jgi:purine nucleosidase
MNANPRHRVVMDCDPGIDDALALLVAAASPEIELLGVTCVAGNRPLQTTAHNACRLLELAGRDDVPVHAGCARPLAWSQPRCNSVHGEDGLGGAGLSGTREPSGKHAVNALVHTLQQVPPSTVTLIAVGPLTNLALAEIQCPGLLRQARMIAVMGGAAFCPGNVTPSAEFNFHADPLAAHVVLSSGAPISLFGLDVTRHAVMPAEWIASLAELGARGGAAYRMLRGYASRQPRLHDACPVAWLIEPTLFVSQRCSVEVEWRNADTEGRLLASPELGSRQPLADVFTSVDTPALLALVRQRLQT